MTDLNSFEDFVNLTDAEIESVIAKAEWSDVALSLLAAGEKVKEKFLRNMSGDLLVSTREELEVHGLIAPWCRPESDQDIPTLNIFDDLLKLTDREIQAGLREIDQKDVVMALKGAREEVKQKLFSNMSERVQNFIDEQLKASKSTTPEEVESAQRRYLETTTVEARKAVEKIKDRIVTARDQVIQIHQSEQ